MTKKYNIIYADPPWQFNSVKSGGSMKSGSAAKYNVMSLEQLKALDVPALCEKDCVLIMWYVSSQPQEALDLVKAWGFTIKNMNAFIWRKLSTNLIPHFGMGYWTRGGAECALLAVRGKPKSVCKSIRQVRDEPVGEHSEKPGIFRDDIVKLCGDLPRLEMFARTAPAGWDVFGNEVESSVDIAGNEPATKCVEQSGTHINEGAKVCASENPENEIQTDLSAESEQQSEPEQKHYWPYEVMQIVDQALAFMSYEADAAFYERLCASCNKLLLIDPTQKLRTSNHIKTLISDKKQEAKSCAA